MAEVPDEATTKLLDALCHRTIELLGAAPSPVQHIRVQAGAVEIEMTWPGASGPALPTSVLPAAEPVAGAGPVGGPGPALGDGAPGAIPPGSPRHYVCAPTVGTFYRRPEPGARPFIEVGDVVDSGHQVAILEAMKLMNAVEADQAGRVVAILVEDGASVEHGQPLLALEPSAA